MTISWSEAPGNVDGYRVWAYVSDRTQEDQTFGDPSTLSHTFSGKDGKTYDIDIYNYVMIDGEDRWSSPIEGELMIGKVESLCRESSVNL